MGRPGPGAGRVTGWRGEAVSVERVGAVVIGAGQAGLAVSHELRRLGRDHVVLEKGQLADA